MDLPNVGGVSSIIASAVIIMYAVWKICKKSHCRSKCFGKEQMDIQLDLEETTTKLNQT